MKKLSILRLKFIDAIAGLKIYETLQLFKKHQYLPKEELDKIRLQKLEELFSIAKQSTVYYAPFNSYDELPLLTKNIMKEHPDHFLSKFYKDKLFKKATGGTTGTPFVYYTSVNAQSHLWAGLLLSWESTGYEFGDKVAFVAGNALMKSTTRHGIFYRLMNIDLYPAASMNDKIIAHYLKAIRQNKTRLIYGYAMAINTVADYIKNNNVPALRELKGIVCTSEMLTDKMRADIEDAFGVKVFNQYGCNEAGISAFECDHSKMHLISTRSVYETDADGNLAGTDLANEAYIFMKYDTGDIVELTNEKCSCGRCYPILQKVIGRSNDLVIDMKNKKFHSSYFNFLFKTDKSIRQYQVLFDENSILINLLVDDNFTAAKQQNYLNTIKSNLYFDSYEIKTNVKFYSKNNAKHTYIIDKRKEKDTSLNIQ
jgi:phenylacetate-CoA ligase